jgi:hypothetical protein
MFLAVGLAAGRGGDVVEGPPTGGSGGSDQRTSTASTAAKSPARHKTEPHATATNVNRCRTRERNPAHRHRKCLHKRIIRRTVCTEADGSRAAQSGRRQMQTVWIPRVYSRRSAMRPGAMASCRNSSPPRRPSPPIGAKRCEQSRPAPSSRGKRPAQRALTEREAQLCRRNARIAAPLYHPHVAHRSCLAGAYRNCRSDVPHGPGRPRLTRR